jgi:hypothetical protein
MSAEELVTFSCVDVYTCHLSAIIPYCVLLKTGATDKIKSSEVGLCLEIDPSDPCRIIPVEGALGIITIEADEYIVEAVMYLIYAHNVNSCLKLLDMMALMKRAYFKFPFGISPFGIRNTDPLPTNPYIAAKLNGHISTIYSRYVSTGVRIREHGESLAISFSVVDCEHYSHETELVEGKELHWLCRKIEIVPIHQNVKITPEIIVSLLLKQNIVPMKMSGKGKSTYISFEKRNMGQIANILYHSLNCYYEAASVNKVKSARNSIHPRDI